jgi:small nuclear ribonucleoprotein (snRNP)-like protein
MLINKQKISDGDILCFKLVNGDEVVAKLVSVDDLKFTVSKPCTVMSSAQGIGLMQSLFCGDINTIDIELRKDHVLMFAPVIKEMENHYLSTVTGIKTVSKGSIVV